MLKNFKDYYLYMFKLNKINVIILIIDLSLFIASTYTLITEWSSMIISDGGNNLIISILLGTIIKFLYDSYKMVDQVKSSMDLRYGYIVNDYQEEVYNKVKSDHHLNCKYDIETVKISTNRKEPVLRSKMVDKYIRENSFKLVQSKEMQRSVRKFIKENSENLLPFLKYNYRLSNFYGKMFFNEVKFCLSSDIKINDSDSEKIIYYHKGTYYDTYLTNIISGKELRSNQDNALIASAKEFMPVIEKNGEYYLKDITSSCMNNEVGVSTIGITSDNYLVLWTQNRIAQSSGGLLVPTGSGSCDWKDIIKDCFNDTIISAMKRELWEENGGKELCSSYRNVGQTKIIGYFRWIKKGGKAEFVGLTKVDKSLLSFSQQKTEVFNREEYLFKSIEELNVIIDELLQRNDISVPLFVNLKAIKDYLEDDPEGAKEFLKIQ